MRRVAELGSLGIMSEPLEKKKWSKEKVTLFFVILIVVMVGLPLSIILWVAHKLSQIH